MRNVADAERKLAKTHGHTLFAELNRLENSGGQLSTVVQALSLHTTAYLMGDLK